MNILKQQSHYSVAAFRTFFVVGGGTGGGRACSVGPNGYLITD